MRQPHFSKLQLRFFASYLVVMLLVMICLVLFAYRSFSNFHSQILLGGYQAKVHLLEDAHEQLVSSVLSIAGQMTNNDITPVHFKDDPVKASRISGKLASYRAVQGSFDEIFVHFTGDEYVYSSTSFFLLDRFVTQALLMEDTDEQTLREALENTTHLTILPLQHMEGYAVRSDSGVHSKAVYLVPLSYPGGARVGTVMYLVDESVYQKWFSQFGLDSADAGVFHRDRLIAGQDRSGLSLESVMAGGEDTVHMKGERYHIMREKGSSSLGSVALISGAELRIALSASVSALVLVASFAAALSVLLITRFVQSRMKGIKLVQSMLGDHVRSGDELIEIRDGVQRLIDENASMTVRLEDMVQAQRSDFVRRFLLGHFADEDAFLQMAEAVSVNVDLRHFMVAVIAKAEESSYELTPEKIDRLFDEQVSGASLMTVSTEKHLVLVAFANEEHVLREFMQSKFAGLKACCTSITMAVSACHDVATHWKEGQRAYLEADSAFEMRFIRGNTAPIFFADHGSVSHESDHRQAVEHLRQALKKGDEARTEDALREVSHAMHDTRASLFAFRCMYSEIITMLGNEGSARGVREEELYDLFRLSRCLSVDELDGILSGVCRKIMDRRTNPEAPEVPEPVRKAWDLIHRRFSEPGLTVSGIAEEAGMSDSKLSVEFKKYYHETPMECITYARMHRAKRLLRTTDMPVKDIATECGYYDISAFNRRFKTHCGCTPLQYRQGKEESEA